MTPAMTKERREIDIDWREALDGAHRSLRKGDIDGWELKLVRRRVENELTHRDEVEAELRALVEKLGEALEIAYEWASDDFIGEEKAKDLAIAESALTDYHAFKAQSEGEKK